MSIYFVPTIDHLPYKIPVQKNLSETNSNTSTNGFLYMFHTDPQPDDINAYVKVGRTEEQLLISRLKSYLKDDCNKRTVVPVNIYYSNISQYCIRETILKRLCNNHPSIKPVDGREYFYGNYNILKTLFIFVTTISDDKLTDILSSYLTYLNPVIEDDLLDIGRDKEIIYKIDKNTFDKEEWYKTWNKYIKIAESTCPQCDKFCNNRSGLASHIKKCSENLSLECEYCHFIFSSKPNLVRHHLTCENRKQIDIENALNSLNKYKSECEDLRKENEMLKQELTLKNTSNSLYNDNDNREEFKRLLEERKMLYTHIQLLERVLNKTN